MFICGSQYQEEEQMNKCLDFYLNHYDNLLVLRDFNTELKESCLHDFSNVNDLKSLKKEPACCKNLSNPSSTDLFLTNCLRYFQNTSTIETEISDLHKLVGTVLKMFYKNQKAKIVQHRNYKTFNE